MTGVGAGANATARSLPAAGWLWTEAAVLFVGVPAAHIVYFDALGPFLPFAAMFAAAVILLWLTPGFRWRSVVDCRGLVRHLPLIAALTAVCVAVAYVLTMALVPGRLFGFPRFNPERYALVIALYPFLSVLGQELAYRLLFFGRYRGLFPNDATAIVASAAAFALAHGFFLNGITIGLSFAGGLAFAWAYVRTSSFPVVWILHSLAGQVLFTFGLGIYFYHGAIPG